MHNEVKVEAYFDRIGYRGPREPTLATLRALHELHPRTIPFENLNPLLRLPVLLDAQALQNKLVRERRGGYCFEHNLLFKAVLESLGFEVIGLAGRVMWNKPEDVVGSRAHMVLLVTVEGERYLADVGFGGLTLTAPLLLSADLEQSTPHEVFRLAGRGAEFVLQARLHDQWRSMYRFDLQEQLQPDYEVSSWYLSNHPQSIFVNNLMVARVMADGRYGLSNGELTIHTRDGATERRQLHSAEELRATLYVTFGIVVPEVPHIDTTLEAIAHRSA